MLVKPILILLSYKNMVIDTINSVKFFSKFYHRHSELVVEYNIDFKLTTLQQGKSEAALYGGLVYKFKRIVGKLYEIIKRYKNGIQHGYHGAVCMLGCKANHSLKLWFPL